MGQLKPIEVLINGETAGKTIKELESTVKGLGRELKTLPIGSQAFIDKSKEFEKAKDNLNATRDAAKQVGQELAGISLDQFGAAGSQVSGLIQRFTNLRGGVGTVVQAFGALKTAVISTGLGALLIIVTALVTYFSKTDDGARKLDGAMRALGNITNLVVSFFAQLGEKIMWAFENPKQALKDLSDMLINNVLNRFKAFLVLWEALKEGDLTKAKDGIVQLTTGITNASEKYENLKNKAKGFADEISRSVKEGMALADLLDAIDDQRRETELATAQNEKLISRLLLQAKNRTLSEQERIALLQEASKLETANHKMQLDLNAQNIKAVEMELAAKVRAANAEVDLRKKTNAQLIALANEGKLSKGTLSDEDLDKYNQVLIGKEQLDQKSLDLQEKINNRRAALDEQIAQRRQKAFDAQKKAEEKAAQEREQRHQAEVEAARQIADKEIALIADETKQKEQQLQLQANREKESVEASKASAEQKARLLILIEQNLEKDLAKVRDDAAKAEKDRKAKADQEEQDLVNRRIQATLDAEVAAAEERKRIADRYGNPDTQRKAAQDLLQVQIINEQERTAMLLENASLTEEQRFQIIQDSEFRIARMKDGFADEDRQRNANVAANIIQGYSTAFQVVADFQNISAEKQLARAEKDKQARLKSLDDEYKRGRLSKEEYEKAKTDVETSFADKTKEIKNEQAKAQKQFNVAQAIMQGAIAVIAASANPLGILSPTAIATAVMAGVNVAKVIATPVPEFAKGGRLPTFKKFSAGGVPQGPSHREGGMNLVTPDGKIAGNIQGGEPILSVETYANNPELVEMLLDTSMNRGGARLAIDPVLLQSFRRYEAGGILPGGAGQPAGAGSGGSSEIAQAIRGLGAQLALQHQETVATIKNVDTLLKAYVVPAEVGAALDELRSIKREASGSTNDGTVQDGNVVLGDLYK